MAAPGPDARARPPARADERATLEAFLDHQRATLLRKVEGLDVAGVRAVAVPPSSLTLAGLVKHLTSVEDVWFGYRFAGAPPSEPFASADWEADEDWELTSAALDDPDELVAAYRATCDRSRAITAEAPSLDAESARDVGWPDGGRVSLRFVLTHMIEETARHNGHADLLREAVDGVVGE